MTWYWMNLVIIVVIILAHIIILVIVIVVVVPRRSSSRGHCLGLDCGIWRRPPYNLESRTPTSGTDPVQNSETEN